MQNYGVNLSDIKDAAERIAGIAHVTPVMTSTSIDIKAGKALFFKCECFQKVGAFKFRGATNAVLQLSETESRRGVLTHSSGNHAQALALAAKNRGITAHIVMPSNSPLIKQRAVAGYGANIYLCEPTLESREEEANRVQKETGAVFIHPYDHPHIIAGQGTVGLELLDQVKHLDALVVPLGGGGQLSGIALAVRELRPEIVVYGVEPSAADDAARSKAVGSCLPPVANPGTIADGLLTGLGELTWPVIRDLVSEVITVEENEIIGAMRLIWERMKVIVEPSAAVSLAGVLTDSFRARTDLNRVGVILSGGNLDLEKLPWKV
jgi:threonine dehydratase/serine racemase